MQEHLKSEQRQFRGRHKTDQLRAQKEYQYELQTVIAAED